MILPLPAVPQQSEWFLDSEDFFGFLSRFPACLADILKHTGTEHRQHSAFTIVVLTFGVETEIFTSFEEQCVWYIRLGLLMLAWNDMTISRLESVYAWWDVWKKALFIKKYEYGILMASCERDAVLYTRSFLGWTRWLSVYWEYRIMPI